MKKPIELECPDCGLTEISQIDVKCPNCECSARTPTIDWNTKEAYILLTNTDDATHIKAVQNPSQENLTMLLNRIAIKGDLDISKIDFEKLKQRFKN